MSGVLLATAARHTYSCDANLRLWPLCFFFHKFFLTQTNCGTEHSALSGCRSMFWRSWWEQPPAYTSNLWSSSKKKKKKNSLRSERGIEVTAGCSASLWWRDSPGCLYSPTFRKFNPHVITEWEREGGVNKEAQWRRVKLESSRLRDGLMLEKVWFV